MTAPNSSTALATVLIDELSRNGIEHLVLGPGSRSGALALAAYKHHAVTVHVVIDERGAGFRTLGIARGTGKPAAALTTSGTAAANLLPAVVEASMSAIPILLLTADRPPELHDRGANQTIDQVGLFGSFVRWSSDIGPAEDLESSNAYWRSTVSRAVAEAAGHRSDPGPVHLNLAFREPIVPQTNEGLAQSRPFTNSIDGRPNRAPWTEVVENAPFVSPEALERVAKKIGPSRPGILVAGAEPLDPGAINRLSEKLGWPILADPLSRCRRGSVVSYYTLMLGTAAWAANNRPEVAIRFGKPGASRVLEDFLQSVPEMIQVGGSGWSDPAASADIVVRTNPSAFAAGLAAVVDADSSNWSQIWLSADRIAGKAADGVIDGWEMTSEPRLARDVALAVPDNATFFVGSSMPIRDVDSYMAPRHIEVVANRGASGIDGSISTALGLATASGPVVALIGDLAFIHDQSALALTKDQDCVLVVANNGGGGIFSFLPQASEPGFETLFGTPHDVSLKSVAKANGVDHTLVADPVELIPRVEDALDRGGVTVIEAASDRAENVELHAEIQTAVESALR